MLRLTRLRGAAIVVLVVGAIVAVRLKPDTTSVLRTPVRLKPDTTSVSEPGTTSDRDKSSACEAQAARFRGNRGKSLEFQRPGNLRERKQYDRCGQTAQERAAMYPQT